MANKNLNAAKTAKKDEFYTQLSDIERELQHYWPHFRDKVVLCNCDDPYESNFFKYFALNFNQLGLKKLICTCYDGSPVQGNELLLDFGDFTGGPKKIAYKVEITEVKDLNGDGAVDLADVQYLLKNDNNAISILKQHGDFRSAECVDLLKESDIVVTNPPFSLFREYVSQLVQYDKKYIILGNKNAITYKEVFPLIMRNQLWVGQTSMSKEFYFHVPQEYIDEALANNKFRSAVLVHGKYMARSQSIWYTNLDIKKRHEEIDLVRRYSAEDYPRYDNYNAIEVGKVEDIPLDFEGIMGVPITFLDKYNPEQFEILGTTENEATKCVNDLRIQGFTKYDRPYIKGVRKYARILIRNKHPQKI